MIKTFIFVEDGSVDVDDLTKSVGNDVKVITDNLADERDYDLHEGEIEKLVHEQAENLPWVKAIIVYIKLPEV